MEIELSQLFGLDEKNVFNLSGDQNGDHNNQCIDNNWNVNSPSTEQIEYKHKFEKTGKNRKLKHFYQTHQTNLPNTSNEIGENDELAKLYYGRAINL